MSLILLSLMVLAATFALSRLVLYVVLRNKASLFLARFGLDAWIYLWGVLTLVWVGIGLFLPSFADTVFVLPTVRILLWCGGSALIYGIALLDIGAATRLTVLALASAVVFLSPSEAVFFSPTWPFWADRLTAAGMICLMTYAMPILNGIGGILSLQMAGISLGMSVMALLGGLPSELGLMAAGGCGLWLACLQLSSYPSKLELTDTACMSIGFLFGCLMLQGGMEFAMPSMAILTMYLWAELIWALVSRYIRRRKTTDLYENTGYWELFLMDIHPTGIVFGVSKILLLNVLLSWFQLYAPNRYSMPAFAFAVDVWFLYNMYRTPTPDKTLSEVNREIVETIKNGLSKPDRKE